MPHRNIPPSLTGVPLHKVRNRTEKMVMMAMDRLFKSVSSEILTDKDRCDIYALALNRLPSQYAQSGTIILGRLPESDVDEAVLSAYDSVIHNPKE